MTNDSGIYKMDGPDDPNRCQAMRHDGQCTNKAVKIDGDTYGTHCLVHGGNKQIASQEKKKLRIYNIGKFQAQLEKMADSPILKSLHEEVGLLRMMLETIITRCETDVDLIINSHVISDLILKIEKTVVSTNKLEKSMGQHLDKAAILQFASEVVNIVGKVLDGEEDKINQIANGILEIVGRISEEAAETSS